MLQQLLTILIGLAGGVSVGIQSPVANSIGQRVGSASSSLVIHVSGAVFSVLLLLARGGENIRELPNLSWWMFGSGLFGVILYVTINHTIPRIGATAAVTLIIVGQLLTGLVIDHFGLFGVTLRAIDGTRVIAVVLLLAGGYLMAR